MSGVRAYRIVHMCYVQEETKGWDREPGKGHIVREPNTSHGEQQIEEGEPNV